MDQNLEFMLPKFSGRPIILSPPPMEPSVSIFPPEASANPPQNYQRNQSVGYNLQQEFEALKADLDLDLSYSNRAVTDSAEQVSSSASSNAATSMSAAASQSAPPGKSASSRVLSGGPSLLSPSASQATPSSGFPLSLTISDTLLRDQALSPGASNSAGLQALLNNKSTGFLPNLSMPSRPQSVNDFSNLLPRQQPFARVQPSNFYSDMLSVTLWLENLPPQDVLSMLDYWCNNLPFDILLTIRLRLDTHMALSLQPASYNNYSQFQGDYLPDMDSLLLSSTLQRPLAMSQSSLVQPKPKANAFRSHLFADPKVQRPKLADPALHNKAPAPNPHAQLERARSPAAHLNEKTNFLQLAAASSNSPHGYSPNQQMSNSSEDGLDLSAANKLGALATINSRVALDLNRKNHQLGPSRHGVLAYEELINRAGNSLSVPAVATQKYSAAAMSGPSALGLKNKAVESPIKPKVAVSSAAVGNSLMPNEIASMDLLNNIPAWLKLLRLHKYTDCLKDMYWKELVELSDQQLEDKGVKALGARRKLLKAFDTVRQTYG